MAIILWCSTVQHVLVFHLVTTCVSISFGYYRNQSGSVQNVTYFEEIRMLFYRVSQVIIIMIETFVVHNG